MNVHLIIEKFVHMHEINMWMICSVADGREEKEEGIREVPIRGATG